MQTTSLSILLNRIRRWQALVATEDQYLVRDMDASLRAKRKKYPFPWNLQKGSLRVFSDVLEYPVATDHDELAYLDDSKSKEYGTKARFKYTSLKEFYQNPDDRNDLAEIWDGGTRMLGVRYNAIGAVNQLIDNAEDVTRYTGSDDVGTLANETVIYKKGNGSIKVPITLSAGLATIKSTFLTSFTDANYKRKYHFRWVYLDAVPTSIEMRLQVDDSNYLSSGAITTQFSGQAFKADQWNLIAFDLNTATETGTISTASVWASEKLILTGAPTGTYYIDESNLRAWALMDYWYYSKFNVVTSGASKADQEYFMDSNEIYSSDSSLVGDSEWTDVIMYDAMLLALTDVENTKVKDEIRGLRNEAWASLADKYPSLEPVIITSQYRFTDDFNQEQTYDRF